MITANTWLHFMYLQFPLSHVFNMPQQLNSTSFYETNNICWKAKFSFNLNIHYATKTYGTSERITPLLFTLALDKSELTSWFPGRSTPEEHRPWVAPRAGLNASPSSKRTPAVVIPTELSRLLITFGEEYVLWRSQFSNVIGNMYLGKWTPSFAEASTFRTDITARLGSSLYYLHQAGD
jgi:hypothetical protein